jgi:hypothetical protein
MFRYTSIILVVFFMLAGCSATGPVYRDAPKAPAVTGSISTLHIYRTGPFLFGTDVFINDELLLSIPDDAFTWVRIEPGIHHFEINASAGAPAIHFEEELKAGVEYYLFLSVSGVRVAAAFVSKEQAMSTIPSLIYAAPAQTLIKAASK